MFLTNGIPSAWQRGKRGLAQRSGRESRGKCHGIAEHRTEKSRAKQSRKKSKAEQMEQRIGRAAQGREGSDDAKGMDGLSIPRDKAKDLDRGTGQMEGQSGRHDRENVSALLKRE